MSRSMAELSARAVIDKLYGTYHRCEIAGSIRRGKPQVHDVEIVVQPKLVSSQSTLDGTDPDNPTTNLLDERMRQLLKEGVINTDRHRDDDKQNPFGKRYYRINYVAGDTEIPIDVFAVLPPAQWGVIFLLRTGSGEFSHWFVQQGYNKKIFVRDGHLVKDGDVLDTPEEYDVFKAMGVHYREPKDREMV